MIFHVYASYAPADPDTARRQRIAQMTWSRQPWQDFPVTDHDVPRLWREDGRAFPFIRDIFDAASYQAQGDDILLYTNSDIQVRSDACMQVAAALVNADACYCYRRDFHHRVEAPVPDADYASGIDYAGTDLFAFRNYWWQQCRDFMPDMLIAFEAWDCVLRYLIQETHPNGPTVLRDLICHERHGSYWENPAHRYKKKAQLHNLALAKAYLISRRIDPRLHGIR